MYYTAKSPSYISTNYSNVAPGPYESAAYSNKVWYDVPKIEYPKDSKE